MRRPSASVTAIRTASCTTWLLVRISPSGVNTNPDPPPRRSRGSPERVRPAALMHFNIHDRRTHALDRARHCRRIGVEQGIVVSAAVARRRARLGASFHPRVLRQWSHYRGIGKIRDKTLHPVGSCRIDADRSTQDSRLRDSKARSRMQVTEAAERRKNAAHRASRGKPTQ